MSWRSDLIAGMSPIEAKTVLGLITGRRPAEFDHAFGAIAGSLRERFEHARPAPQELASALDLVPLEWRQPFGAGSGRWSADTRVNGLDVEVTVNGIHPGPHCPCAPGECKRPGVPYATVWAQSFTPMAALGAPSRIYLTCAEQSIHVADPLARPAGAVHTLAAMLSVAASETGREALRELNRHAVRLGIEGREPCG